MDRIELMEMVRSYQVGGLSRREFLTRSAVALGSLAAANSLLAACAAAPADNPPPVVDATQPPAEPGTESASGFTTGIVTYPAAEGDAELMGYLAYEEGVQGLPAVIVLQEWWGLNEHIKDVTRRFAAEGYMALAPDLYHGVVTTEPDEARKQAMELGMRDAVGEIQQAIAYLRSLDNVGRGIGVIGFCMGGGLVLQTALAEPSLGAGVVFYGSPLSSTAAQEMTVPILTALGTADGISADAVRAMHAVFDANNISNQFNLYDGAQHAFFNDTRASYDEEAARDAWTNTLDWFARFLS